MMIKKTLKSPLIVYRFASAALQQSFPQKKPSVSIPRGISVMVIAALLSACTTATPAVTSTAPAVTITPTPTPIPAEVAVVQTTLQEAINPTALDPCQLLPSEEASKLAGASFGDGVEETLDGGSKSCVYGANTINVLYIVVAQAADVAAAEAAQQQFVDDIQANLQELVGGGVTFVPLDNFADAAIAANLNLTAINVNGAAFGFRKGTVFFGFSDLVRGGPAPTSDAMQAEAMIVLGRLP